MYNSYEEYMRDVLGYPYNRSNIMQNTYNNTYNNNYQPQAVESNINEQELQECYPEIYNIVKPMIKTTCQMYAGRTITKEVIEEMTLKIYNSVETNENRSVHEERKLKNGDGQTQSSCNPPAQYRGRHQSGL